MSTFPQPWTSTTSHWQATDKGPSSLWRHNRSLGEVPPTADIVIVGAGMMGSALAYFLTREGAFGQDKKIICLDAKDLASGASGRNGGHVGPKTFKMWNDLMQPYPVGISLSAEEAARVTQNERDNLDLVQMIVEQEGLAVDFWRGELLESEYNCSVVRNEVGVQWRADETKLSKKLFKDWTEACTKIGLGEHDTKFIDDPQEAERLSRLKDVTSVHVRPSGSVHPHKLATALMGLALSSKTSDFQFYSWCPAVGFPKQTQDGKWAVKTPKGEIVTANVILCTNAHTPNFFVKGDPLRGHIQPAREQCVTITPPASFSGRGSLRHTYNTAGGHYMVTTPAGEIVLGGGLGPLVRGGRMRIEDSYGQVDDSEHGLNAAWTDDLRRFCREHFIAWGDEAYGEGMTRKWAGILSRSKDSLPLVGEIPGSKGVSLCAGFSGHGMSRIFTTARAWAQTLASGKWDDHLLPRSYELTSERLAKAVQLDKEFHAEHGPHVTVVDWEIFDPAHPKARSHTALAGETKRPQPSRHSTATELGHRITRIENLIAKVLVGYNDDDGPEVSYVIPEGDERPRPPQHRLSKSFHHLNDPHHSHADDATSAATTRRDSRSSVSKLENAIARVFAGHNDDINTEDAYRPGRWSRSGSRSASRSVSRVQSRSASRAPGEDRARDKGKDKVGASHQSPPQSPFEKIENAISKVFVGIDDNDYITPTSGSGKEKYEAW